MERPKWQKPSKYQLGFDFGQPPLGEPAEIFRFTYAVQEEVQVLAPADAAGYLLTRVFTPFEAFTQEEVWMLSLNNKNKITHQSMVYRGTLNQALVRVGEIFRPALHFNAAAIIYVRWNIKLKRCTLQDIVSLSITKERSGHEQHRMGALPPRYPPFAS